MCYKETHGKGNGAAHLGSLFWDLGRLRDLNGDVVITNNFYLKTVLQEEWHRVLKRRPVSQLNPPKSDKLSHHEQPSGQARI